MTGIVRGLDGAASMVRSIENRLKNLESPALRFHAELPSALEDLVGDATRLHPKVPDTMAGANLVGGFADAKAVLDAAAGAGHLTEGSSLPSGFATALTRARHGLHGSADSLGIELRQSGQIRSGAAPHAPEGSSDSIRVDDLDSTGSPTRGHSTHGSNHDPAPSPEDSHIGDAVGPDGFSYDGI